MSLQVILPQQYDSTPVYELLRAVELGRIGFDQRLIRALVDRRDETLSTLAKWVEEPRHEDRIVNIEEQCFDLFRYFRSAEAVPFYMKLLKGNPAEVPDELVEAFSELGAPALDAVLDLYSTLGEDDRGDVAFLLAAMGVHDDRVKAIFLETLERDRYEGALCIGLYRDASLKPQVQAALESLPESAREEHAGEFLGRLHISLAIAVRVQISAVDTYAGAVRSDENADHGRKINLVAIFIKTTRTGDVTEVTGRGDLQPPVLVIKSDTWMTGYGGLADISDVRCYPGIGCWRGEIFLWSL